jgi:hypothetical protein
MIYWYIIATNHNKLLISLTNERIYIPITVHGLAGRKKYVFHNLVIFEWMQLNSYDNNYCSAVNPAHYQIKYNRFEIRSCISFVLNTTYFYVTCSGTDFLIDISNQLKYNCTRQRNKNVKKQLHYILHYSRLKACVGYLKLN